jgi:HEPN domain-containing protein
MIDFQKQIDYWINGAQDDLLTADILIQKKRNLHGLFFCHLVIEKALKAHYVKTMGDVAPRTHNLIYLVENAGIILQDDQLIFLGILMKYQLQGRYPDYNPVIPDQGVLNMYFVQTGELFQWLKMKL